MEQPLSAEECIMSVIDPKGGGTNKHRYIVASQDAGLRRRLRDVAGVPLVYVSRSVMVMEPMAAKSEEVKDEREEEKVRSGVKRGKTGTSGEKRKREGSDEESGESEIEAEVEAPKKKRRGPKGANPLSALKPKKPKEQSDQGTRAAMPDRITKQLRAAREEAKKEKAQKAEKAASNGTSTKRKRKKHGDATAAESLVTEVSG
ncbi:putative rRNA-processing protein UTP23 [Elsinoe fawcettii]|nr:putative rRNA-processing protein UTP23 [Elsinoe fawcettii]